LYNNNKNKIDLIINVNDMMIQDYICKGGRIP